MRTERITLFTGLMAALAGSPCAHADGDDGLNPYLLGVYQGYSTDSNLFRAPSGGAVERDRIWSSGVRAGLDLPFSRQRLTANASANYNNYQHNHQLNNTDYDINARLDWQTIERISGVLSAQTQQTLYRDTVNGVISTERNQLQTSGAGFQARIGIVTLWSFEAGVAASKNDYSTAALQSLNLRQEAVNVGVRWRPSDALNARLGVRHTEGRYPNWEPENDHFKRDDIDLNGSVEITGASTVNARISATRVNHTLQNQRDANGTTGALQWLWKPTGKLTFDTNLSHDNSVGRTTFDSPLITSEAGDTRTSDTFVLNAKWAATSKIQVAANGNYVRRKLDNSFNLAAGSSISASDRTTAFGLGVRWQPLQSLEFGCTVGRERRTSDGSTLLTVPYTADTAGCSAQLSLR